VVTEERGEDKGRNTKPGKEGEKVAVVARGEMITVVKEGDGDGIEDGLKW
jgi:hypothetical protein